VSDKRKSALKDVMSWPTLKLEPRFLPGAIAAQGGYFFKRDLTLHTEKGQVKVPAYTINFSPADRTRLFANETRIELLMALERQQSKARIWRLKAYLAALKAHIASQQDPKPPEAPGG
jgi:hypothetical protein